MHSLVLSKSEMEIAERIALGESKKEVAYHTHRSVYTVETTVKNIYEKLGFNKLSDLVLWYCGVKFNITFQITERKRQILTLSMLLLLVIDFALVDDDFIRARRSRRSKKNETELII